jgi:hypothetical protein
METKLNTNAGNLDWSRWTRIHCDFEPDFCSNLDRFQQIHPVGDAQLGSDLTYWNRVRVKTHMEVGKVFRRDWIANFCIDVRHISLA